jgi:hypothetical protein
MGPIGRTETSVCNYHCKLRSISEELRSQITCWNSFVTDILQPCELTVLTINWKGCGRKRSLPVLRYSGIIRLEGRWIAGSVAQFGTRNSSSTKQQCQPPNLDLRCNSFFNLICSHFGWRESLAYIGVTEETVLKFTFSGRYQLDWTGYGWSPVIDFTNTLMNRPI